MKNITVSIEEDLYRKTRVLAAQANTSVTGLVRQFFEALQEDPDSESEAPSQIASAIRRLRGTQPGFSTEALLSRDEIHARGS